MFNRHREASKLKIKQFEKILDGEPHADIKKSLTEFDVSTTKACRNKRQKRLKGTTDIDLGE